MIENNLIHWFEKNKNKPFAWGEWDCFIMVCDFWASLGYEDYSANYNRRYKTGRGAYRVMKNTLKKGSLKPQSSSWSDVYECFLSHVGFEVIATKTAGAGDIASVEQGDWNYGDSSLALVAPNARGLIILEQNSLNIIPFDYTIKCWRFPNGR